MSDTHPSEASPSPTTALADPAPASPAAGLSALKKMSTTAGVGTGDYAAISPLAIAATVAGFLGLLAFLSDFLLVVPFVAILLAVMGLIQIRRSSGTLTGNGLAVVALVLGLGVAGGILGAQAVRSAQLAPERRQILAELDGFGKAVVAADYPAAYQLCDAAFQSRVGPPEFSGRLEAYERGTAGKLQSVEWNGVLVFMAEDGTQGGVGSKAAVGMALFRFKNLTDPVRVEMIFSKTDGKWAIADVPSIFPRPQAPRAQ